jgi:hypothetical protein
VNKAVLSAFDLDKVAPPDHLVRQIDGTRSATSSIR